MGTLWHSCAKVREPIELSFGMMSGIRSGIGVLDGSPRAPKGRAEWLDSSRVGTARIVAHEAGEFIFCHEDLFLAVKTADLLIDASGYE